MPEFITVLMHIVHCDNCRLNPEMKSLLDSYKYWNDKNDEYTQFNERTLTNLKNRISSLSSHIHEYV